MDILAGKDSSLRSLVNEIAKRLPEGAFVVVDDWEADPLAIALARPTDHDHLVYIHSEPDVNGRWFISREMPRKHDLEEYDDAGVDQFSDIDSLASAVADHLAQANHS
jgi:hypothetical protein